MLGLERLGLLGLIVLLGELTKLGLVLLETGLLNGLYLLPGTGLLYIGLTSLPGEELAEVDCIGLVCLNKLELDGDVF